VRTREVNFNTFLVGDRSMQDQSETQEDTCQAQSDRGYVREGPPTYTPAPDHGDIKETCFDCRKQIEIVKMTVQTLRDDRERVPGEIGANITLAYRHLEDARMRLGKAVQALDGGASCYPR